MAAAREVWSTKAGFILAAVGSAVGLGNMWRFSYVAADNGGAAFVLLYLGMMLVVGLPVMLAEFVVGRRSRRSPAQAFLALGDRRWQALGYLGVEAAFLILAYYGVIAGWVIRYAYLAMTGGFTADDAAAQFVNLASGPQAVVFQLVFMGLTVGVVAAGVKAGIEKASLVLMPVLFLLVVALAIYAATLEGGGAAYGFYLRPDFSAIWSMDVLVAAAGQAFFSLSLGMGAMLTFASYLERNDHLPNSSLAISGADVAVAFVAGLMVFPIVFAFGLQDQIGESTVGALFIALPQAFDAMGGAGRVVGFIFFATLLVGALTSAISLLEVVVSHAIDTFSTSRLKATLIGGLAITVLGLPAAITLDGLSIMDQIAGTVFLVLGALGIALFVGWRMDDPEGELKKGAEGITWTPVWRLLLRYVAPILLAIVAWFSIVKAWAEVAEVLAKIGGG